MGRPRRKFEATAIYLVRNFCLGYRARFLPEEEINRIIWGLLCKHATRHGIEIFGFVFMQSFFEILLRAPRQNLHEFMHDFQGDLARAINLEQGEHGRFFADRYTDERVMEDQLEQVLSTIIGRPCTENLVAHPSDWPGACSWAAHQTGEALTGEWVDSKDYWLLRRRHPEDEKDDDEIREMAATHYDVELARLPCWKGLSEAACREKTDAFAADRAEFRAQMWASYGGEDEGGEENEPPGIEEVLECSTWTSTHAWHPVCRGRCVSGCEEAREAFYAARRADEKAYTDASVRLRRGRKDAYFPAGMIPPGHLHCVGSPGALRAGEKRGAPKVAPEAPDDFSVASG